ncbi:MAG TPA: ferritin-like domain-containing protein [Gemmatimonadaceae bacterium]|nr:ferritin-like domain-containing protein [Gemmatimonadaceae bacterium]
MPVKDLRALLKHELGDLYFAEKHILKALKKMTKEATDPELRERMERHQSETEGHIDRVERAFAALDLKPKAQKCPGILGIIEEHDEFKEEEEPTKETLAAFDMGSGLRVEHYEIAAYRGIIALSKALGEREVADLMAQNLAEEVDMEKFLVSNSVRALKELAREEVQ